MTPDGEGPRPAPPPAGERKQHSDAVWQPREVQVRQSVAQYTRFVQRMKIGLPVAAGVILLLVLLLPQFRGESERFRIGLKNITDIGDTLSMQNARYFGTDDKGEPFSIKADMVKERPAPDKLIDLTGPKAEMSMKDGRRVNLNATNGVYDRTQEILDLAGQVDLVQKDGYEMHTSQARVMLKESTASGDAPVTGKGSMGDIEAAGFRARQSDNVIIFTGPAKLVLNGEKKSETKPAETKTGETKTGETKPAETKPTSPPAARAPAPATSGKPR